MIGPTSKMTISEKPCGINQTQMKWTVEITDIIKLI